MKNQILIITLLFFTWSNAQNENNIWYFGYHAGLDFNAGNPTAIQGGQTFCYEGGSSLSDATGHLLFYTDGVTVWCKDHQIMPNGQGLKGNVSTTQSSIIIPIPNQQTKYYIFTVDERGGPEGVHYSIVDLNENNGLGAVTTTKNVPLISSASEKIAAIKKPFANEYWLIFRGFNNNTFYVYSITANGISTPLTCSVGSVLPNDGNYAIGAMKLSQDGSKLIACYIDLNAELYDFDMISGQITNPRILNTYPANYGVEFSPSGDLAYITSKTYPGLAINLYQYDLTAQNIMGSETLVQGFSYQSSLGQMQLALNGKIYVAGPGGQISVINNPENIGVSCQFQTNIIALSPGFGAANLNTFVGHSDLVAIKYEYNCFGNTTDFSVNTNQAITAITWDFGDGTFSTTNNPSHQYLNKGTYTVVVTYSTSAGTFTRNRVITIAPLPVANPISNQIFCSDTNLNFNFSSLDNTILGSQPNSSFKINYYNSLADATTNSNALPTMYSIPTGTHTFFAKISSIVNKSCADITSFTVTTVSTPLANAVAPVIQCDDSTNDGIETFNLGANTATILGTQNPSNYTVSYHINPNDAATNSAPLGSSYQNTNNPETIYARVTSIANPTCYATTSFTIKAAKVPIAHQPLDVYGCDDDANDGKEFFDLQLSDAQVLGNQLPNEFAVSYYSTPQDANSGTNPLITPFRNTTNPQTIYIRISNIEKESCFATTSMQLIVKEKPILNLTDMYSICEGNTISIAAPSGFDSYIWSTGATSTGTTINQAGNYTLTVTKDYGTIICGNTKNITVYNSNVATITNITTEDFTTSENIITVFASGDGDYEYSLDGINYQDSPQFLNVTNGQYSVSVRDKKGCGIITKEVYLLMYPKFFTPNGDGYNDLWKINFSEQQPNMKITILDRYGKLIAQITGLDAGWNGTNNGKPVLSDDYWFVIKKPNGDEYKGHFALKR